MYFCTKQPVSEFFPFQKEVEHGTDNELLLPRGVT